jgi:polyisoprenoid-binding protein YceI
MYENILQVERFPTAVYESNGVSVVKQGNDMVTARVNGELSFHGFTQPLSLAAQITNMGTMLRISGEFLLLQSDYGIKAMSFAGGTLRLRDEVKFNFSLVARKQD